MSCLSPRGTNNASNQPVTRMIYTMTERPITNMATTSKVITIEIASIREEISVVAPSEMTPAMGMTLDQVLPYYRETLDILMPDQQSQKR